MQPYLVTHWINGQATAGHGDSSTEIRNPATGAVQGHLRLGSVDDLNTAASNAGLGVIGLLSASCKSDLKKLICAKVYMPCVPNG